MDKALRALIVEDSEDDATLLVRELQRGGYQVTYRRVDTAEALAEALERGGWDILFVDYTMPRFRGTIALAMVRAAGHDLPFIFVSGTIGEDVAVEAMKAGADDYVLKGNLKRLLPAVARELRDAAVRREHRRVEAERRAAEEALRASEERQRLLFQHIADAILVFNGSGAVSFASASVRDVLGYEPEALTGRASLELVHPDDQLLARQAFGRASSRPGGLDTVVVRMRHQDGSWRTMECVLRNLLHQAHIRGLVVTCRDVTEREHLEAQVRQAQKVEAVGRLAGGIAHDFNNLLTAILGETELALLELPPDHPLADPWREVRRQAERAAALTGQLLAFSRRQVVEPTLFNPNDLVSDLERMLRRLIGEDIELVLHLDPALGTVLADRGHIEQVLVNLAVNSRDAMPAGGRLTLETANVELDETYVERHPYARPAHYVMLGVSDTGTGMSEEARAHLFEPFFTTKEPGRGTGLGLAVSFGIVKQAGGHIGVYSEPGIGTTVKVYLPRAEAAESAVPSAPVAAVGGHETILLVEDDEPVRRIAVRILTAHGYRVFEASNGEDAVRLLADASSEIDLLITDVVMPGMSGLELADRVRMARPAVRVLFTSGYPGDQAVGRNLVRQDAELLQKPFSRDSLSRKVRQVLDAPPRAGSAHKD